MTATLAGADFSLTGNSTPTFVTGNAYQIFAMAVDSATNKTSFPGLGADPSLKAAGGLATPAGSPSKFIYFDFNQPPPESLVTVPPAGRAPL